jgi:hypothetical protein
MPYLSTPEIWMPQATAYEKRILSAIYARISARVSTPSAEFIAENPDHEFSRQ